MVLATLMSVLNVAAREFRWKTNFAEVAESHMVSPYDFCGRCGAEYPSADDQFCRICGTSINVKTKSSGFHWNWRFVLVIPAFLIGILVPGMLVRISTELVIPAGDTLFLPLAELGQSMADGAFSVFLPRMVAPHSKMQISFAAGILVVAILTSILAYSFATNYYAGAGTGTVVWQVILFVLTGLAAGVAMLYAQVQRS